eukprot:COSAG02_NODE_3999_length_5933_cov_3.627871_5_plen_180_part_00
MPAVRPETKEEYAGHDHDDTWLDVVTRRMYGLALAATRIGSNRDTPLHFVLVSSMAVFAAAPDELAIQTNWERRPSTGACTNSYMLLFIWGNVRCDCTVVCLLYATEPQSLAPHLAEFVLEQFSREQTLRLSVLRIGTLATIQSKPPRAVRCYPHFSSNSAIPCVIFPRVSCSSVLTPD